MPMCSIPKCEKPASSMGWCRMHYYRWYRHGDVHFSKHKRQPTIDRFWDRVDQSGDCWEWARGRSKAGYGVVKILGVRQAHRVAYTLEVGPIPNGLLVCHHCDNPPCCNPDHLFIGTDADNSADSAKKLRSYKLHKNDVERVLNILRCGEKQQPIADYFDVCRNTISKIKNNTYWGEIWPF